MQEEVVVNGEAQQLQHISLRDEWVQLCLECALACPPPSYSRWQDIYDIATGKVSVLARHGTSLLRMSSQNLLSKPNLQGDALLAHAPSAGLLTSNLKKA